VERKIERREAEAVNVAEELLLKARRVRRLIEERVRSVMGLDDTPTLHAPGVEPGLAGDEGRPRTPD
jgi:hypothetical protein